MAYAFQDPAIQDAYEAAPFSFGHYPYQTILDQLPQDIGVATFSVSLWNEQLSLKVAEEVRRRFPEALIVFGGCHIPFDGRAYLAEHPFIDLTVSGEGEAPFAEILARRMGGLGFDGIPGISTQERFTQSISGPKDLDVYPSPYLTGWYESLLSAHPEIQWQAIIETNRGCLQKGTKIVTMSGEKCIEEVSPGERVLGWDEENGRTIWNVVERAVCTGEKQLIEIRCGSTSVRATYDHPFYTERGWVAAGELKAGEKTLHRISRQNEIEEQEVLQELQNGNGHPQEKQVRPIPLQSHLLTRVRACIGGCLKAWQEKPNEKSTNKRKGQLIPKGSARQAIFFAEGNMEKETSYDAKEYHGVNEPKAIRIRDGVAGVLQKIQDSLAICRGLFILDWPMQIWQAQESRFYQCDPWPEEGGSGSRQVLASERVQKFTGDRGLQVAGLGGQSDLGRRHPGQVNGGENKDVHWVRIDSISTVQADVAYDLINATPFPNFFANGILVHNCPYSCSFCYWGNALNQKYRFFSPERIDAILQWCADHRLRYIFNADSNFGMLPNDQHTLDSLIRLKEATGYPEKFRTCWGKNSSEKIYDMAKALHAAGLDKGLTLARQSHDPDTLKAIHRTNIKLDAYTTMQEKANRDGIPVYSEVILGLPGETKESFKRGVEEILSSGISNQLFIYHAELLPNTEMASPAHREKYGLVGVKVPLRATHTVSLPGDVVEYDEIVVATHAMPAEDWRYCTVWSWVLQALHGMKLGFFLMKYTHETYGIPYTAWVDFLMSPGKNRMRIPIVWGGWWGVELSRLWNQALNLQKGMGKGQILPEYGGVYWDEEEAAFLRLQDVRDNWDNELAYIASEFADLHHIDQAEITRQADYQSSRIPRLESYPDKPTYAREVIIKGRKSGTNLTPEPHPTSGAGPTLR